MADTFRNLKVDRTLIDASFDGYKLSLDSIPKYQEKLGQTVDHHTLSDSQYSLQHIKAFGLHNHVVADLWDSNAVYIVDKEWKIIKWKINESKKGLASTSVFEIPKPSNQPERSYNVTVKFASPQWAVVADGCRNFHIVSTDDRNSDQPSWKISHSHNIENQCIIPYAVEHSKDETTIIELVCLTVEHEPGEESEEYKGSVFITNLHWLTFHKQQDEQAWSLHRIRKLESRSSPDYVALEADGSAIHIASERPYRFVSDSVVPVEEEREPEIPEHDGKRYTWSQTQDDLTVLFTVPEGVRKPDIDFHLSLRKMTMGIKNGPVLLQGELYSGVDSDGCTWTLDAETRRLTLELSKQNPDLWPNVVVGDTNGEMTTDAEQIEAIHEKLRYLTSASYASEEADKPAYNAQQLEDCDFSVGEQMVLARLDGDTHKPTHQVNLTSPQWLFTTRSSPDLLPLFCLRHDVDGIIWQPTAKDDAPWQHTGTFNALGYVAASKQDRKFAGCAPDLSFAFIADCSRHVYIYWQPSPTSTPVRNRKTKREVLAVAKQQLVSLENMDSILGVHATNESMFLLTESTMYLLRMKED